MVKPRREQLTNIPINTEFSKGLVFDKQNAGFGAGHVSAGKGIIWINNTFSPSHLIFTDESGTDHDLSTGGSQTLAQTLGFGHVTGGTNIQITSGDSIVGQPGVASAGGNITVQAGGGSSGFNGGNTLINGGTGLGAGSGGAIALTSGAAGATGNGGEIDLLANVGGATSGNGGGVFINSGFAPTAGNGGDVGIEASNGGSVTGNGGSITIASGAAPTAGNDGYINLNLISGVSHGLIQAQRDGVTQLNVSLEPSSGLVLLAPQPELSTGFIIGYYLSPPPSTLNANGGSIALIAQKGNGIGAGGEVALLAGDGGASGHGGPTAMGSGAGSSTANGAEIILGGGDQTFLGTGGGMLLQCGHGGTSGTQDGGLIEIVAGNSNPGSDGYGGSISISTGNADSNSTLALGGDFIVACGQGGEQFGSGKGGSIIMTSGDGASSGDILLKTGAVSSGGNIKGGDITLETTDAFGAPGANIYLTTHGSLIKFNFGTTASITHEVGLTTNFVNAGLNALIVEYNYNIAPSVIELRQPDQVTGEGENFVIHGVNSTGGGNGGDVTLVGGTPAATTSGGQVALYGGPGGATSGDGGIILVTTGSASGGGNGGDLNISTGVGVGTGRGGNITVLAGNSGGGATGNGGDLIINAGNSVSTAGNGGSIILKPGTTIGGLDGYINLQDSTAANKIEINTTGIGFFATSPATKPTIAGSRAGNAALASLLTGLASLGLITDSSGP